MHNLQLFKVLSDKSRLLILNSLKEAPMDVERLAKRLNLAVSTVSFHLKKLEDVGLVSSHKEQYYKVFSINDNILTATLNSLITLEQDPMQEDRETAFKQTVLDTFMPNNIIKQMPRQQKKKIILLEQVITQFDKDKRYTELEVNDILKPIFSDHCELRRALIDFRFLTRDKNIYKVAS